LVQANVKEQGDAKNKASWWYTQKLGKAVSDYQGKK
jgi:hypothetical protein